jgi:small subunit ribosomal protein S8
MVNDKIADMLIQIKNAGKAGKKFVSVPHSIFLFSVAEALLRGGYIASVSQKGKKTKKIIEIEVAYKEGNPKIKDVKRISKLSRRVYYGFREIKPVKAGYGVLMLSTPKGILTGEEAKKENVGGEALFKIL